MKLTVSNPYMLSCSARLTSARLASLSSPLEGASLTDDPQILSQLSLPEVLEPGRVGARLPVRLLARDERRM